jgi:hypothetical protein
MSRIIKRNQVRVGETRSRKQVPAPVADVQQHGKRVRLVRDGAHVHAIELTCNCGEVTVLALDYDDGSAPATSPEAPATVEPGEEA